MSEGSHFAAAASFRGRRRLQEDAYFVGSFDGITLLVVADGMGGHSAGDVASRLAVKTFTENVDSKEVHESPRSFLERRALAANQAILDYAKDNPDSSDLGTTLVLALIKDRKVLFAHAGDSRATAVSSQRVSAITRDHSAVQDAIDRGILAPEEVENSPYRHAVLRHLGDPEFPGLEFTPDKGFFSVPDGVVVVLTSDGAHDHLTPADFLQGLCETSDLATGVKYLARVAFRSGSDDNITVVAAEMGRIQRSRSRVAAVDPLPEESFEELSFESLQDMGEKSARKLRARVTGWALVVVLILLVAFTGFRFLPPSVSRWIGAQGHLFSKWWKERQAPVLDDVVVPESSAIEISQQPADIGASGNREGAQRERNGAPPKKSRTRPRAEREKSRSEREGKDADREFE